MKSKQKSGEKGLADCPLPKKVGRLLSVVETAELLNIFLIVLMALFLNAQGRAEFPVQILCLLMNWRAFQTFDVGCVGKKRLRGGPEFFPDTRRAGKSKAKLELLITS